MRILIVEDNPSVRRIIDRVLVEDGHDVVGVETGVEGEAVAGRERFDVIILDVMLPDVDGLTVCGNLRQAGVATPILMLTSLSSTADKIRGLNAGADDYLAKPFDIAELIARLRALHRRADTYESATLSEFGVIMDLAARTVTRHGIAIHLSNKEFMLLQLFMRRPGEVLQRDLIANTVWNLPLSDESNVIDVCVSTLRRKLDKPFDSQLIHTVVGAGYVFKDGRSPSRQDHTSTPQSSSGTD